MYQQAAMKVMIQTNKIHKSLNVYQQKTSEINYGVIHTENIMQLFKQMKLNRHIFHQKHIHDISNEKKKVKNDMENIELPVSSWQCRKAENSPHLLLKKIGHNVN